MNHRIFTRQQGLKIFGAGCGLAIMIVGLTHMPWHEWLTRLTKETERAGWWGVLLFMVANAIATALLIPGWIFTASAGLLYGVGRGVLIAHTGSMAGAALAFSLGRHFFRGRVERLLRRNPHFVLIDQAIGVEGWKIVCLVRLSPLVPFFLQNYLYSVTLIRFWPYLLSTIICTFPGTLLWVYVGASGRYGTSGQTVEVDPWRWSLLGAGFIATLASGLYFQRIAKKALSKVILSRESD